MALENDHGLRMTVVAELDPKRCSTITRHATETVIMRGHGEARFICGGCDAPILEGEAPDELKSFIFTCKSCGSTLKVPG